MLDLSQVKEQLQPRNTELSRFPSTLSRHALSAARKQARRRARMHYRSRGIFGDTRRTDLFVLIEHCWLGLYQITIGRGRRYRVADQRSKPRSVWHFWACRPTPKIRLTIWYGSPTEVACTLSGRQSRSVSGIAGHVCRQPQDGVGPKKYMSRLGSGATYQRILYVFGRFLERDWPLSSISLFTPRLTDLPVTHISPVAGQLHASLATAAEHHYGTAIGGVPLPARQQC